MSRIESRKNLRVSHVTMAAIGAVVGSVVGGAGLSIVGCASPSTTEPAPVPALEPFTESLSGTALSFDMVPVAAGRVTLDVDGAPETVDVGPFWIATHETTWEFYDVFVFELDNPGTDPVTGPDAITRPSRPYVSPDRGYGHHGYATISAAYRGADQYGKWLSAKTGRRYRLPTEAEWLLVCAQSGVTVETADAHAWMKENAEWTPHPVGEKQPDDLGLYDLWGNVREWCTAPDGEPVALGGSFKDTIEDVGCTARAVPTPEWQMTDPQVPKSTWWLSDADFVGIRVLCEPE